ncbi:TolB family protein [Nocardioides sp. GCM10027113]|uniref:TolB family protein n=1 Tax=unclassified Nocardioides TaxID=2615069 RepID=UPI003614F0DE
MHARPRGTRRLAAAVGGPLLGVAALGATLATTTPAAGAPGTAPAATNERVALVNETDEQPDAESALNGTAQVTSHDGRYVVFSTEAALVPHDDNGILDVYLRDTGDGHTVLVSERRGRPGNDYSHEPTISADGRYVAFTTWATDLVRSDSNGHDLDVVVKDMQTGTIERVSVDSRERQRGRNSFAPVISGNGRYVSFQTFGAFGPRDQDRKEDVYVRDLRRGTTRQASLLPGSNRDVRGPVLNGDISDDGRIVAFGYNDNIWVRDMAAGKTVRVHHEEGPPQCFPQQPTPSAGRPVVSGDGRFVAFSSCAEELPGASTNGTDIWRVSLRSGAITRVTAGDDHSYLPSLSRTGRFVGFGSDATDLVRGDDEGMPDAFVADLRNDTVVRASETADGTGGDSWSATFDVAISGDGRSLAYATYADNLVPGVKYDWHEVLVWRR